MRKVFRYVLFSLTLLLGSAMVLSADDKKDDKKKEDKDVHKPVLIVVYVPAWSPVIRAASLQEVVDTGCLCVENSSEAF